MSRPTDLFFDLDGTLTDPAVGITSCIRHALDRLGVPAPEARLLLGCVGPPLDESFAELLGTRDEARVAEAIRLYRERFAPIGMFENQVFPDVPGGLERLRGAGYRLRVVTSKPHVYARRILEHFHLVRFFEGVHGPELTGDAHKGRLIRGVLASEAIPPERACMVGDRVHDVAGARENGVAAVGVLWGYGSRKELAAAAPTRLVESMAELCEHFGCGA